jgi:hypothetical protein
VAVAVVLLQIQLLWEVQVAVENQVLLFHVNQATIHQFLHHKEIQVVNNQVQDTAVAVVPGVQADITLLAQELVLQFQVQLFQEQVAV